MTNIYTVTEIQTPLILLTDCTILKTIYYEIIYNELLKQTLPTWRNIRQQVNLPEIERIRQTTTTSVWYLYN
jgi:uncharacterized protein YpbB